MDWGSRVEGLGCMGVGIGVRKADSMLDEISNSEASKAHREGRQQVPLSLSEQRPPRTLQ